MNKDIKIYEILVKIDDENTGMLRNSFVDYPAVEYEKINFSKDKVKITFSEDKSEQKFMSVSMLADTPIPRINEMTGEVYGVVFSKDTIKTIVNKLVMENKINEVSFQHTNKLIEGVYLVEHFFVEEGRVETPLFQGVPDGSWITTYWVKDTEQYNELVADESFNGFSIELNAQLEEMFSSQVEEEIEKVYDDIVSILESESTDEEKESKLKDLLKPEQK